MKKNVLVFGSIAGIILGLLVFIPFTFFPEYCGSEYGMFIGYGSMIIAFAFIFTAIKNYRDEYNGGVVSFGKAFQIGLLIVLMGSTFYVIVWMFEYHYVLPDFMEKYSAHQLATYKAAGHSAAEVSQMKTTLDEQTAAYHNPFVRIANTYIEVLPVGLLIAIIASLVLMRKTPANTIQATA